MLSFGKIIVLVPLMMIVILFGCSKDEDVTPDIPLPTIRLKAVSGENNGVTINYLALSKETNYAKLPERLFDYDKEKADWFIDGGVIPFTTSYKMFLKPVGEYYYLLNMPGHVKMGTYTVISGSQTIVISASGDFVPPI